MSIQTGILVIELIAGAAELRDNVATGCGGTPDTPQLAGTLTLGANDSVTLIYEGGAFGYLELGRANN